MMLVELYRLLDLGLAGAALLVLSLALRWCMKQRDRDDDDDEKKKDNNG